MSEKMSVFLNLSASQDSSNAANQDNHHMASLMATSSNNKQQQSTSMMNLAPQNHKAAASSQLKHQISDADKARLACSHSQQHQQQNNLTADHQQ